MTNTQHKEDIEESFVYIIKTKDFNKSIVKIPFPKESKFESLIHLGHQMFSADNYYLVDEINEEDERIFFIAKLRFR